MSHELALLPFFLLAGIILVSFAATKSLMKKAAQNSSSQILRDRAADLLMNSELSTAMVDLDLKIIFCNKRFAGLYNSCPEKLFNQSLMANFPFSDQSEFYKILDEIRQNKKAPEKPALLGISLDKSQVVSNADFFVMVRPFKESGRDILLITITFPGTMDIKLDDIAQSIRQKDIELKKLEEMDRLKSEFLATLSHELKTPLVSIKGYLDLMESEKFGPLTDGQRKALRVSLKNTSNLNSLISSILNFARMEAGKLIFELAPQRIGTLITDVVDSLKPISDKRNIEITANFQQDLPHVLADGELISRVLTNLLENSIKFSEPSSKIVARAFANGENKVLVSIEDEGCGIPEDKINLITRPFYQVDKSDTRPRGGLGLGLAICEKILDGHDTKLKIVSDPNKGSIISFELNTLPAKSTTKR